MNKSIIMLFFSLPFMFPYYLRSQTLPQEGAILNYRLIGFSFPEKHKGSYTIEIAKGNYNDEDSFTRNIMLSFEGRNNKVIEEVPFFDSYYTWQVVYTKAGSPLKKTSLYHFSIGSIPGTDTSKVRLRILKNTGEYKNAYIFLGGSKTLYDMKGNPVWYLPGINGTEVRDLKMTPQGTITFINGGDNNVYEVNYNGDILWRGPNTGAVSGDTAEHYHHEFTRLDNGHYMVLGYEKNLPPADQKKDDTVITDKIPYGTIIEYDEKGNLIWSWNAFNYFKESDLKFYKNDKDNKLKRSNNAINVHPNAFYFDQKNNVIYAGFRNISRILKINYPEGYVMDMYGEIYKPGISPGGNHLFCGQHSISISQKGYLLLFNNNSCSEYSVPELMMLEATPGHDSLKKIWAYDCVVDSVNEARQLQNPFASGGNVTELPDQSLLAYMGGGMYSRVFIVSPGKEILWSAAPEEWDTNEKKWKALIQYRASIISNTKDMERLIWNQQLKP